MVTTGAALLPLLLSAATAPPSRRRTTAAAATVRSGSRRPRGSRLSVLFHMLRAAQFQMSVIGVAVALAPTSARPYICSSVASTL